MAQYGTPAQARGVGIASLLLGVFGLAMCWWTPTGMILSLAGLVLGLVACATARRGGRAPGAVGMILSAFALTLCWIIAAQGMELIRFGR